MFPEQFVAPSTEEQQQIEQDKAIKAAAFAKGEPLPEWTGNFTMPVEASASDSFGTARVFNGKVASVHRGTDFRVVSGTPVHAANAGQVVLANPILRGKLRRHRSRRRFEDAIPASLGDPGERGRAGEEGSGSRVERRHWTRDRPASAPRGEMGRRIHRSNQASQNGVAGLSG